MKKILTALVTVPAFIMLILPASAAAATHHSKTDVTGLVTFGNHTVRDAKVVVTCNGHKQTDWTDHRGVYSVTFNGKNCPDGTTVTVVARKGSMSGSTTGTVYGATRRLNVAVVNVAVPEFGWVTGAGAATVGAGALLAVRRRKVTQNSL